MFIYADAHVCPGCRSRLEPSTPTCAACGLDLTGPEPGRVFEALQRVDALVVGLYAPPTPTPTPAPTPTAVVEPAQVPLPPRRAVVSAASVPRILLGLGALCLLIASLVFLAVAWAVLGVDGRTAVLGGFALVAAGLTYWVAGRDLRAGAEAFATVSLGLLTLVLGGAREAGWFGSIADDNFLLVAGLVVATAGASTAVWAATTPVRTLVSAELISLVGLLTAAVAAPAVINAGDAVAFLTALSLFAVGAAAGHSLGLRFLAIGAASGAALSWLGLVGVGALRLDGFTFAHLWGDLVVWPLLVATGLAAVVAVPRRLPTTLRIAAAGVAVLLGTVIVTAVSFDESATRIALVELAVVGAYAVLVTRLPAVWKWICAAPSVLAGLGLAASVVSLTAVALEALVVNDTWSRGVLDRLDHVDIPLTWPLLLPAGAIGISVVLATILHCDEGRATRLLVPGVAATLVALALLPTLYGAPLGVAVAALLLATAALAVARSVLGRVDLALAAAVIAVLTLLGGLASDWVTAALLAALTAAAIAVELRAAKVDLRTSGALIGPLAGTGLIWTVGHLAGLDIVHRALPVLLVLGVAILVRSVVEREVAAGVGAMLAVGGSLLGDGLFDQTWLAIYLTIAGVFCTAAALLRPERRVLAWVGLGLLTLAQWVRLDQLGVGTVEAYTLPLAIVLLVVGTVALLRGEGSSMTALSPGLGLALVPSLLLVLVDPVGLRAVLLGLACVALVVVGLVRGWAAPLLAGAAVGALVVLRQGTLAEVIPQWALIGLVGVALTVVGVTWEQRLQEIRKVSAYVRGLR
jgi:hypothetical protein